MEKVKELFQAILLSEFKKKERLRCYYFEIVHKNL